MSNTYDLNCKNGIIIPSWKPISDINLLSRFGRATVYLMLLIYMFIGVAMACDRLMTAIEVITSWERTVIIKTIGGSKRVVKMRVWNKTVATLTLLAFGPSSPVIILAAVELFQKKFDAGDLGPGVIIGSAAFNCFLVVAFCMIVIPKNHTLAVFSPRVIEIWEGLITLLLFPVYIFCAYCADRGLLCYKYFNTMRAYEENDVEFNPYNISPDHVHEIQDFEDTRREYAAAVRELRKKKPNEDLQIIEAEALKVILNKAQKSRAYYRLLANRALIGDNVMRSLEKNAYDHVKEVVRNSRTTSVLIVEDDEVISRVQFKHAHYTVMESSGVFDVQVLRTGDLSRETTVTYETQDGTAIEGTDYVGVQGSLKFMPGMEKLKIKLEVIDDDVYEQDKAFYVLLKPPSPPCALGNPFLTTIVILDDDHSGLFSFEKASYETSEAVKLFYIKVIRHSGARGKVVLPYYTEDGTAKADTEYTPVHGKLIFENEETENYIGVPISHEASYDKEVTFYVHLQEPYIHPDKPLAAEIDTLLRKSEHLLTHNEKVIIMGRPKLGEHSKAEVKIRESQAFRNIVDTLSSRNVTKLAVIKRWKEALFDTYSPTPLGDEFEEANMEIYKRGKLTWYAALTHFLTLMWNVILIVVPPAGIFKGIPSFLVAFFLIILETVLVTDLALHFACICGVKEGIVAIVLLAAGLSLPEFYADSFTTLNDDKADIPLSSVYASNAIQIYLGLGLCYTIACLYHWQEGTSFQISKQSIAGNSLFFCAGSTATYVILIFRRYNSKIQAELGGPTKSKWTCAAIFLSIWVLYFTLTVLELEKVIALF